MSDLIGAASVADDRPDLTVLCVLPVALPFWRLRLRVDVLARRRISPIEEFVMRAAQDADARLREIQSLLGLDDHTAKVAVQTLVAQEHATITPAEELKLTARGREVLATSRIERAETRVIDIDYDGLLRRPLLLDVPLNTRQRRQAGLRELPASPPSPPDLLELDERRGDLQRLLRAGGDGRDQEIDLLTIRGVLRADRVYQEALLLGGRTDVGEATGVPLIDGALSHEHELAIGTPAMSARLRLAGELRRGPRHDTLLPAVLRERYDAAADSQAATLRRDLRDARATTSEPDTALVDAANSGTRRLAIRVTQPFEQLIIRDTILRSAVARVSLTSPLVTSQAIDRELIRLLQAALAREVRVDLWIGIDAGDPPPALNTLIGDHPGLSLHRSDRLRVTTVIRDDDLALRTTFPLLAHVGRERPFRDERGWLVSRPENVRPLIDDLPPS